MGDQDSFFEALGGETPTGFFTNSTDLSIGVDVQGNQIGVRGRCQGPVGDGVQGFGSGNFSGVAGFGGGDEGTGVVGFGGGHVGPGIRGIGAGGPNVGPRPGDAAGLFGQGGPSSSGVIGQAGANIGDGVRGFGTGEGVGVLGVGGSHTGTGVTGLGGGVGSGVRGIGAGGPGTFPGEPAGVFGQGGPQSTGVIGQAGAGPADGVRGFATGNFSGVAGFGGTDNGTGVIGFGGGGQGQGLRGIGAGGPNIAPGEAAGVFGQGGPQSTGVVGQAGASPADGVRGFATGNFSGVAGFGGSDDGSGVFGFGGGAEGQGVRGIGAGGPNNSPPGAVGVYGQGGSGGIGAGVWGQGAPFEPGVVGMHGPGPAPSPDEFTAGVYGISAFENAAGVVGETTSGFGVWGFATAAGGLAGIFDGPVQVNGNFSVTGAKSAVVPFPDGSNRRLYSLESPESWFEDFGSGHFVNGEAEVLLDAGFASVVNTDTYHVFITEYDDNNALYVTKRTSTGFRVCAKLSNKASGTFSYRIVAKRKDIAGPRLEPVTIPGKKLPLATSKFASKPFVTSAPAPPE